MYMLYANLDNTLLYVKQNHQISKIYIITSKKKDKKVALPTLCLFR